jgi:hypothetical protein
MTQTYDRSDHEGSNYEDDESDEGDDEDEDSPEEQDSPKVAIVGKQDKVTLEAKSTVTGKGKSKGKAGKGTERTGAGGKGKMKAATGKGAKGRTQLRAGEGDEVDSSGSDHADHAEPAPKHVTTPLPKTPFRRMQGVSPTPLRGPIVVDGMSAFNFGVFLTMEWGSQPMHAVTNFDCV